jgi:hypothetical protein
LPDAAPACVHDEGSLRLVFSGLNHTAFDLAVYASQDGSPHHHARLASRLLARSYRTGLATRRVPIKGFTSETILLFRVTWRKPGSPRDYSLGPPQIRTCPLKASGSSRCGIAVPRTTGPFRGDTRVRHDVLGVVPTPGPQRGAPFAPPGPEGRSPASLLLWGAATPCHPSRRASCASLGDTTVLPPVRPHQLGARKLWIILELVSRSSSRQSRWRGQGLPSSFS